MSQMSPVVFIILTFILFIDLIGLQFLSEESNLGGLAQDFQTSLLLFFLFLWAIKFNIYYSKEYRTRIL